MGWRKTDGCFNVAPRFIQGLRWQCVHQIEIEIVKIILRNLDRTPRFIIVMDSAQSLQVMAVETLYPNRQPIDAASAIRLEFFCLESAWIGFHRYLSRTVQRQQSAYIG